MKYEITDLFEKAADCGASDLHIATGIPPMVRVNGHLEQLIQEKCTFQDTEAFVKSMLDAERMASLKEQGQCDYSYAVKGKGQFRVNAFMEKGSYSIVARFIGSRIPSLKELHMPPVVGEFTKKGEGLILVTGPTGSGKTTTLASMIDAVNNEQGYNIITLEDPIEYLHVHKKSIVRQREVGVDTVSYSAGLRAALRQDPDIILVGEMRDLETISIVLTAAETGHLVLSTLHTIGSAETINRIIDVFPQSQQQQIRIQLASVLRGVISQQLIPTLNKKGRMPAVEIMQVNSAIRNLIREAKTHQINSIMQMGGAEGMMTMDSALIKLYKQGSISYDQALFYSQDQQNMSKKMLR